MRNADQAGLTTTKRETTFEEMLNAIEDSLSDHSSSDDREDGEDEDDDQDDPAGGKFREHDETGWVMGTISTLVQYRRERFRQKQMKLNQLMQPGWGDATDYLRDRDKKYGTTELKVPAVIQPQTADDTASYSPMTFGEPMHTPDSVPRKSQMPHVTSRTGSSHMRLGSRKLLTHKHIASIPPAPMPDWSLIQKSKHVEPVDFNPCILCPKRITI